MRGTDSKQEGMFSYVSPEQRVAKDHPLRQIRTLCEIALKALSGEFDRMYSDIGRLSIAPERKEGQRAISVYEIALSPNFNFSGAVLEWGGRSKRGKVS